LEWSLVNARPRGVISYNLVGDQAPAHLRKLFALESLLANVSPWPAAPEAEALFPGLKPIGAIENCRFADWRNPAVTLRGQRFGSAIFSRPAEAWILIGNLDSASREVSCVVHPDKLPYPLSAITTAAWSSLDKPETQALPLEVGQLTNGGAVLAVPSDTAILLHIR
jgi:hypothetical protein